jgi:hypothetical protein
MNDIQKITVYCGLVAMIIFANGYYRCKCLGGNDILMVRLGVWDLNGWSITHIIWFSILGYNFPDKFWFAQSLGVGWELGEHLMGTSRPSWMGGFGDCPLTSKQKNLTHKNWWFGRSSDILMNIMGFIVGARLRGHKLCL